MSKEILILGKEAFDKLKPDVQMFIKQQSQQIADLETKLAEKEKAIENYEKFTSVPLVEMTKMYEQDKIDYAVEQLKRVKENIKKCNCKDFGIMYQSDAINQVDNQIKQLKEGK